MEVEMNLKALDKSKEYHDRNLFLLGMSKDTIITNLKLKIQESIIPSSQYILPTSNEIFAFSYKCSFNAQYNSTCQSLSNIFLPSFDFPWLFKKAFESIFDSASLINSHNVNPSSFFSSYKGVDDGSVGVDDGSVGVDYGSVGVDDGSVGVNDDSVSIDDDFVGVDGDSVCDDSDADGDDGSNDDN
ncbi:2431_t:CDS:2, partial [Entrophospora sp. SA101]